MQVHLVNDGPVTMQLDSGKATSIHNDGSAVED